MSSQDPIKLDEKQIEEFFSVLSEQELFGIKKLLVNPDQIAAENQKLFLEITQNPKKFALFNKLSGNPKILDKLILIKKLERFSKLTDDELFAIKNVYDARIHQQRMQRRIDIELSENVKAREFKLWKELWENPELLAELMNAREQEKQIQQQVAPSGAQKPVAQRQPAESQRQPADSQRQPAQQPKATAQQPQAGAQQQIKEPAAAPARAKEPAKPAATSAATKPPQEPAGQAQALRDALERRRGRVDDTMVIPPKETKDTVLTPGTKTTTASPPTAPPLTQVTGQSAAPPVAPTITPPKPASSAAGVGAKPIPKAPQPPQEDHLAALRAAAAKLRKAGDRKEAAAQERQQAQPAAQDRPQAQPAILGIKLDPHRIPKQSEAADDWGQTQTQIKPLAARAGNVAKSLQQPGPVPTAGAIPGKPMTPQVDSKRKAEADQAKPKPGTKAPTPPQPPQGNAGPKGDQPAPPRKLTPPRR